MSLKISKTYNDEEALAQMALDNQDAFKALYEKYSGKMLLYAFNVIKNKETAEDIIQNIFVDFWSKRTHVEINNIESYLFRAVKYQIFNFFRNQKLAIEDITRLNIIDISISASQKIEYHQLEKTINEMVAKLPKRCKEIFEMSRFKFKSHKEIADELGISVQAVKNQISRALIFIKDELRKEEYLLFSFFIANLLLVGNTTH
ncbi:RNA polymerase sigma-70 factor [Pedobacter endophyticus]|uniref:RNA polymerase sigma-70 factor n=1 Tax=Pedobacter endophyticus TaxID=2789740 RepID=A0A7U3Q4P9_9SPHI|nr:RNA polymerase sigma-70 factor [Pedobacter endophyticus]QPH38551.1 RNA polymerase sigma-70 factor [Pedobacter endophyticus]